MKWTMKRILIAHEEVRVARLLRMGLPVLGLVVLSAPRHSRAPLGAAPSAFRLTLPLRPPTTTSQRSSVVRHSCPLCYCLTHSRGVIKCTIRRRQVALISHANLHVVPSPRSCALTPCVVFLTGPWRHAFVRATIHSQSRRR